MPTPNPSRLREGNLGVLFVILNLFQDNMRPWFVILKQVQDDERVGNFGDRGVIPETGFACNVGFVLRFCVLRPHLLRDWLFERVEPNPGFRTR
jgi:hypothetical protein